MADNEPVENRAEVESVQHDSTDVHAPAEAKEDAISVDRPTTDDSANTADTAKDSAPAPQSPTAPNSGGSDDSPVATAPDQAVNPGPPAEDGATSQPEAQMTASLSAPEVSTPLVTPTPTKRFTSMNINKKFLAKTAAGSPSTSSSPAAPKTAVASAARPASANPQLSSRLVTKKLTNIAPSASASGGWLRATPPTSLSSSPAPGDSSTVGPPPSVKPSVSLDVRPSLVSSGSALSLDSRSSAKASRDHSPVKAWATVPSVGDAGRNLQDFPTAAEAAADSTDAKRPGASAVQPAHPAVEATSHNADTDARDSFRGMHLDPNAHHWDEMEDESNDFLGEVIDFGDGKTYTVPPEEGEAAPAAPFNKETRLGDDYDRSWPRSQPPPSEPETTSRQNHGPPPRQASGDGRVLFNERSNRLEPARGSHSTPGGTFHQHAPPFAHLPPRSGARRNSALSSSDRPRMGHGREPPPHTRDPPPHAGADGRARRPSDARSSHSPTERRSSFLHDDDRSRAGLASLRGRDEQGFGMRRETSRDSRLSTGDRPSRGHQVAGHRTVSDPFHHVGVPGISETLAASNGPFADSAGTPSLNPRSPVQQAHPLPSAPGAPPVSQAVAALSEEREKFMKQAAERARRRKQEEEAAREEARERARKKAAELEALSKASLVTASPLVVKAGGSSRAVSPAPRSPLLKSPSVTTSVLPAAPEPSTKPKEASAPASVAATVSSWRSKPKPEPSVEPTLSAEAPSQPVPPPVADTAEPPSRPAVPPPTELGRAHHIEELGKADDGPVEVLDFSEMSKLAGRRTSITSPTELHRRKRSAASDFLDEAPSNRRPGQAPMNAWNKDRRSSIENHEEPNRAGNFSNKHTSNFNKPVNENSWAKPAAPTGPGTSSMPTRSGYKEAPISALDDVMSRIKGVLTDMHAEDKPTASSAAAPLPNGTSNSAPAPAPSSAPLPKAAQGVASRWMGAETNWRDGPSRKVQPPPEPQPTEPFATTRLPRAEALFPTETSYVVRFSKSTVVRSPMPKKQAALAKLPPMPVRWDILSWNPPIERMSTRTLSRDDMFFPKTYIRGVLSARVLLPSTGPSSEAQAKQSEAAASRARLNATAEPKPTRSPTISTRPPPKSPAFMDNQWRKSATSPVTNALELQNNIGEVPNQLETTSRSPPPHHPSANGATSVNATAPAASSAAKGPSKQHQGADVAFHRSLHEKRPSNPPAVSFTVSSELDNPSATEANAESHSVPEADGSGALGLAKGVDVPTQSIEDANDEKANTGKITQSPTPNSSILLTPPVKVTTPWQGPNPRLPDADYLKSVWQSPSPKTAATENSLRGLADDFPSSIPHSVQEMKGDDEERKAEQTGVSVPPRAPPHNAHRNFQQVPTSPAPVHMSGYPNHMPGPTRPIPVASFSLPPPAPPQIAAQPTPYSPYIHPVAPSLMYTMPPSRIAPSPAPGGQMWVQGQAYGRPSPPAGMYPGQQGHAMSYPAPASQMAPGLQKPHGGMNGNHVHPMTSPAMSHAHPMHMGSPAMAHVAHMGSPALGHASPHMPGGPQHMYPGMGSPGGLGMGANMPYGAQRPTPMMQQSPMQGPTPNGYHMMPGGSYGPAGYGRGGMRSASDGMPHHMALPHPQHAPVSPGTYHPGPYGRPW